MNRILEEQLGSAGNLSPADERLVAMNGFGRNVKQPQQVCGRTSLAGCPQFSLKSAPSKDLGCEVVPMMQATKSRHGSTIGLCKGRILRFS
jgi:hypothetical protein